MLGSEENRKQRKKVFVQFCAENIYRNYLYIVISRNQSRNNKECGSIQQVKIRQEFETRKEFSIRAHTHTYEIKTAQQFYQRFENSLPTSFCIYTSV